MTDPTRGHIASQAEAAALQQIRTGLPAINPHPEGTEAARAWAVSLERVLAENASGEGSA